jgi:hypothetical protein
LASYRAPRTAASPAMIAVSVPVSSISRLATGISTADIGIQPARAKEIKLSEKYFLNNYQQYSPNIF